MRNALFATSQRHGVIILIKERRDGREYRPGYTETENALREILTTCGFTSPDGDTLRSIVESERSVIDRLSNGVIGQKERDLLAKSFPADFLIYGTADIFGGRTDSRPEDGVSRRAVIRAKAVDIKTGRFIASGAWNSAATEKTVDAATGTAIRFALAQMSGIKEEKTCECRPGSFIHNLVAAAGKERERGI